MIQWITSISFQKESFCLQLKNIFLLLKTVFCWEEGGEGGQ